MTQPDPADHVQQVPPVGKKPAVRKKRNCLAFTQRKIVERYVKRHMKNKDEAPIDRVIAEEITANEGFTVLGSNVASIREALGWSRRKPKVEQPETGKVRLQRLEDDLSALTGLVERLLIAVHNARTLDEVRQAMFDKDVSGNPE